MASGDPPKPNGPLPTPEVWIFVISDWGIRTPWMNGLDFSSDNVLCVCLDVRPMRAYYGISLKEVSRPKNPETQSITN